MTKAGFKITCRTGFHITFENGYTVSVQFGPGNYCDNYDMDFDEPEKRDVLESRDAEVAVWKESRKLLDMPQFGNNKNVGANFTPEMVFDLLSWAKEQK